MKRQMVMAVLVVMSVPMWGQSWSQIDEQNRADQARNEAWFRNQQIVQQMRQQEWAQEEANRIAREQLEEQQRYYQQQRQWQQRQEWQEMQNRGYYCANGRLLANGCR